MISTQLIIEKRFLENKIIELCARYATKIAIVTDSHVANLYGHALGKKLKAEVLVAGQGEIHKTRREKELLEDLLFEKNYKKDTLLIGLGGGMITDLTGYLAATYMRGIYCILIPTSLLGMVDAAIGGKNGVNTPFGKNMVGTIYPPNAIVIDTETLKTLPEKEMIAGLSEIIKYALIASPPLWKLLETKAAIHALIEPSIEIKQRIASQDPFEKGARTLLNFGHTFAHALETISGYQISHGEAVASGLLFESYLSYLLGYLPKKSFDAIESLIDSIPYSLSLPENSSFPLIFETMKRDKKNRGVLPRFVLLREIGEPLILDEHYAIEVDEKPLKEAYDWFQHHGY
jgi:3-dehydroquinate synthase